MSQFVGAHNLQCLYSKVDSRTVTGITVIIFFLMVGTSVVISRFIIIIIIIIIIITLKLCSPTLTVKTVTNVLMRIVCFNV